MHAGQDTGSIILTMSTFRVERIKDVLLSFLAEELRRLTDPRLEFVTLTDMDLSKDIKLAKIYWSLPVLSEEKRRSPGEGHERRSLDEHEEHVGASTALDLAELFPSESRRKEAADALRGVENLLKRRIAEELDLRYVPKLVFLYDDTPAKGSRIDYLLKKAGF